jgi:hypothetical protein
MFKLKIHNLFKSVAPSKIVDNSKSILLWGPRNDFPQRLINEVYESPTASACMDTFIDFLEGDGITEPELAQFKVNSRETLDELHAKVSPDMGYLESFAIGVKYNALGEKVELKHLPFESIRLGKTDDTGYISKIYYNPGFGTNECKAEHTVVYDVYNPDPEVILKQYAEQGEAYNGQAFVYIAEKPLERFYAKPYYSGGRKWFIIDHKIGLFHERNIDNNFLLSVLMKVIGDPDEAAETNSEGRVTKTVGQAFDEELHQQLGGAENGGKVFVAWAKIKEAFPELQAFPNSTNHDLFIALQQLTIDNISIATKVPPILANIQVAGKLGNSQEIINAIKLMYQRVNKKQRKLERTYKELLTNFKDAPEIKDLTIRNINPVDVIPPEVWAVLTREEQRKFIENNFDIELLPEPIIPVQPPNPDPNGV